MLWFGLFWLKISISAFDFRLTFRTSYVGKMNVLQAVLTRIRHGRAFGIHSNDIGNDAVLQITINDNNLIDVVAYYIGDGNISKTSRKISSVDRIGLAKQNATPHQIGRGRGIHYAIDDDVVNRSLTGKQTNEEAKRGIGTYVANDNVIELVKGWSIGGGVL